MWGRRGGGIDDRVTLKDPIERGLKDSLLAQFGYNLFCCYTQRPDRKGTERIIPHQLNQLDVLPLHSKTR